MEERIEEENKKKKRKGSKEESNKSKNSEDSWEKVKNSDKNDKTKEKEEKSSVSIESDDKENENEDIMDWETPPVIDVNKECRFSAWMEIPPNANPWGEIEKKIKGLLKILQNHMQKNAGIAPWEGHMDNEYPTIKKKEDVPKGSVSNRMKYLVYLGSNYLNPMRNKGNKIYIRLRIISKDPEKYQFNLKDIGDIIYDDRGSTSRIFYSQILSARTNHRKKYAPQRPMGKMQFMKCNFTNILIPPNRGMLRHAA